MLTTSGKTTLMAAFDATHIGLATAYPGAAGSANEVSGGVYAREAATWAAESGGARALSSPVTVSVPGGNVAKWVVAWDALSAGNARWIAPLGTSKKCAAVGVASTDTFTSTSHPFSNGDRVVLEPAEGETLPSGLAQGTDYFIVNAATDTFQVSATAGGSAIDITTSGEVHVRDMVIATDAVDFDVEITAFTVGLNK